MRELLIATMNTGKVKEMRVLLNGLPFEIVGLDDVGITTDVEEPAKTFEGNAIIKAMTYGKLSNKLILSEDSGLEIDALHGEPGVYTKRYTAGTDDNGHAKIFFSSGIKHQDGLDRNRISGSGSLEPGRIPTQGVGSDVQG